MAAVVAVAWAVGATCVRAQTAAECAPAPAAAERVSRGHVVVQETSGGDVAGTGVALPRWSVQVASFETLEGAETLQRALCARGYQARVIGMARPYSVRVGRYPSSNAALTVARALQPDHHGVFVTGAERQ